MKMLRAALVLVTSSIVAGQRGSFAGIKPIDFPDTPNRTTTTQDPLADRFGEGTSEVLPIEANGNGDLIDQLSKLPIDKQPFWYINWQAYEKQRKEPQTYPQRPRRNMDTTTTLKNHPAFYPQTDTYPQRSGRELFYFGEGTSEVLPIEANGNRDLIDQLSKLPIDKQPFWYINWQATEKQRKEPQTYPQRPRRNMDTTTTLKNHPAFYPQTDTYPQRSGRELF